MTAPERSLNHEEECRRLTRRLEREKLARLEAEKYSEELLRHAYERQRDLELLNRISEAANASGSMDSMMQEIVQQVCTHFGWVVGHVYLRQADRMASSRIWFLSDQEKYRAFVKDTEVQTFASDVGLPGRVIAAAASVVIEDVREDSNFPRRLSARDSHLVGGLGVPVMVGREVLAVLEFFDEGRLNLTESQHQVLQQIAGQLARSAERHRAQADVDRQVERLAALRAIDIAISSSMVLNLTLAVFLEQVLNQLDADAANVFLYNAHTHSLTCATSKGFAHLGSCREVRLGSALPGRSALQQRIIYIADIARRPDLFDHFPGVLNDGYVSCIAAPLMAKGNVKGVLEVYKRGHQTPSPDYIDFVEALAGQAAIAVDNATLFHGLQRSNLEISVAYDATIEGWAKALDMRDNETGGHTQRVTEITLGLARILRIPDEDMVHLRRGALLHDIGKMGVPDKILHKPGKLDEEE